VLTYFSRTCRRILSTPFNLVGVIAKASEDHPVNVENIAGNAEVQVERRTMAARRQAGSDRRKMDVSVAEERRTGERRNTQRRRQIDPTTCERDYNGDEIEFMRALDSYKRASGRMFPTCSEILEVIRSLGYAKSPSPNALEQTVA
jgi:hypothetical protein